MVDRNELARQKFNRKLLMKMGTGMVPNGTRQGPTPQEKKRRKEQEAEAREHKISALRGDIRLKNASLRVMEKTAGRIAASRDLLLNVSIDEAGDEQTRKGLLAEADALAAEKEELESVLALDRWEMEGMQQELEDLEGNDRVSRTKSSST
jgi:hypothetical protein